jgi:hypothetical protein
MAKRQTAVQTLEFKSSWIYSIEDIERRSLPELEITLEYLGWDEEDRHWIDGKIKIIGAGDTLLDNLPKYLKGLKKEELEIRDKNSKAPVKKAMEWADEMVAEFLASGLFSVAVVDATSLGRGVYEYVPQLKVVDAKVYKVK